MFGLFRRRSYAQWEVAEIVQRAIKEEQQRILRTYEEYGSQKPKDADYDLAGLRDAIHEMGSHTTYRKLREANLVPEAVEKLTPEGKKVYNDFKAARDYDEELKARVLQREAARARNKPKPVVATPTRTYRRGTGGDDFIAGAATALVVGAVLSSGSSSDDCGDFDE